MQLPSTYNYIGAFLTLRCCYQCSYCINWKHYSGEAFSETWVKALNKLETDLPITIGGGEPTFRGDFYDIVSGIHHKIDLLTNLSFDVYEFMSKVPPSRFDNTKSFAPIRASFHHEYMDVEMVLNKIAILQENGYRIGLYCVEVPENAEQRKIIRQEDWVDFQTKPLLPNQVIIGKEKECECRISELLIAPTTQVFKCHRDLYLQRNTLGFLSEIEEIEYIYRKCYTANGCHPCDVKVKRDRFGNKNYCAVHKKY